MDPLIPISRTRRILTVVVQILVLAGVVTGGYLGWKKWQKSSVKAPEYVTEPAQLLPMLIERTTATGTLQPLVTVQVGAQVSGRIVKLNANYNSIVHQGDLLAELDPTLYASQVAQARANLAQSRAVLQHAEAAQRAAVKTFNRTQVLFAKQLATQADHDNAQAAVEMGKADIANATANIVQGEAALALSTTNLAYCKIYSPVDGVVLSRSVDVGQTVAASLQAPVLFSIAKDLGQMQVHANVDEADIGKLAEGMLATFTVDAFRGMTFQGTISQLRLSPQIVQNVVTYDAVVDVQNLGNRLKPGMTATVIFETAQRKDVLAAPNAALRWRPTADDNVEGDNQAKGGKGGGNRGGGETQARKKGADAVLDLPTGTSATDLGRIPPSRVYVLRGKVLVPVDVVSGVSDGRFTEILSGKLKVDDPVVVRKLEKPDGSSMGGAAKGPPKSGGGMPRRMF
jgi:HlyD family secretion protein